MTIYADVLVAANYLLNLLLLMLAGKLMGKATRRRRLCFAALLGAIGSLIIFLPFYGFGVQTAYKLALAVSMTAAAFGARPVKHLMKSVFVVFTVSFMFAGVMAALEMLFSPTGFLFYNGIVYFNISALQLVIWSAVAFVVIGLLERMLGARPAQKLFYELTIFTNGKSVAVRVLADSGNVLREPFSGVPVIVCGKTFAQRLMDAQPPERIRLIPCSTVSGEGVLHAFRPDAVRIAKDGAVCAMTADVYIAAAAQEMDGEYQAVMNPRLVQSGVSSVEEDLTKYYFTGKECMKK